MSLDALVMLVYFGVTRFLDRASMRISDTTTTDEALRELGDRLQTFRLQQNQTVAALAREAGVGSRTVSRAEAGGNVSLENVIKLLRALGRIDALDAFLPVPLVSPIQLAALRGKERRRASGSRGPRTRDATSRGAPPSTPEPSDG